MQIRRFRYNYNDLRGFADDIGIILFIIAIPVFIIFLIIDRKIVNNLDQNGIRGEGVVSRIEKDVAEESAATYIYYVEYEDRSGAKHESVARLASDGDLYQVRQRITIKYLEGKDRFVLIVDDKTVNL